MNQVVLTCCYHFRTFAIALTFLFASVSLSSFPNILSLTLTFSIQYLLILSSIQVFTSVMHRNKCIIFCSLSGPQAHKTMFSKLCFTSLGYQHYCRPNNNWWLSISLPRDWQKQHSNQNSGASSLCLKSFKMSIVNIIQTAFKIGYEPFII